MDTPELKPVHCDHPVIGRLEIQTCTENGQFAEKINFDVRHGVDSTSEEGAMHFEIDGNNVFHIAYRFYHSHRVYPVASEQQPAADEASGD